MNQTMTKRPADGNMSNTSYSGIRARILERGSKAHRPGQTDADRSGPHARVDAQTGKQFNGTGHQ
jgi:hypothetical protein